MTKRELQQQFGDKLAELLAMPSFHILLDVAREDCPYYGKSSENPTVIVSNEGRLQGWNECLRFLKTIGKQDAAPEKPVTLPRYADPSKVKSDQNRKS